jgi:pimeloyl-ACP methyl ester carboxylesterase
VSPREQSSGAGRSERSGRRPHAGGIAGAVAGAVLGTAAAAGAVGARRTVSRVARQRELLSVEAAEHPSNLGMLPAGRESSVAAEDGTRLAVEEIEPTTPGAEPELTVVLVHGFAVDRRCWHFQRRMLAELTDPAVRVVLYDQRRHGRSGSASARSCTIAQLGSDLDAVIRACVPEGPVVLVGHSMGGMTIMALAERNPRFFRERVAGVALVCTSAGDVMAQGLQRAVLSHRNPTVNVLGRIAHWQPRFVDRTRRLASNVIYAFVQAYSFGDRSIDPALVDLIDRSIAETPLDVLTSFANTLSTHDRRAALAGLSHCEVVIIGATDDRMIPYEHSEVIAAEIPGAELVALEGAGHMAMLEQPGEFDAALLELLRRCTDRSQVLRRLRPRTARGRERRTLRRPRRRA